MATNGMIAGKAVLQRDGSQAAAEGDGWCLSELCRDVAPGFYCFIFV